MKQTHYIRDWKYFKYWRLLGYTGLLGNLSALILYLMNKDYELLGYISIALVMIYSLIGFGYDIYWYLKGRK